MSETKPKVIEVHYYAVLKEQRGLSQESCSTGARTATELYRQLSREHGLGLNIANLRVAINDEFCNWDTDLSAGDVVVFIPPVAGG